jgi:hypothetical protein
MDSVREIFFLYRINTSQFVLSSISYLYRSQSFPCRLLVSLTALPLLRRPFTTLCGMIADIVLDDNFANQSPLPSLDLSNRYSNLSRALSPKQANKPAGFCSGVLF